MENLRIVTVGISGGRALTGAVSRRPPISLYTMVPRTEGYTYDVGVWDWSIVQGPFSVAPCQNLRLRFATFASLYVDGNGVVSLLSLRSHRRWILKPTVILKHLGRRPWS